MRTLRQRLSLLAGIWLLCQFTVLAVTPLALSAGLSIDAAGVACTCADGNGQCPMHHVESTAKSCAFRSTTDGSAAAMASLLGPIAVLSQTPGLDPILASEPSRQDVSLPLDRSILPDSPPPRA